MKKIIFILLVLATILVLAGCQPQGNSDDSITGAFVFEFDNVSDNETAEEPEEVEEEMPEEEIDFDVAAIIEGQEGDLIDINPQAIDPDGDSITFDYSEPFNKNGLWQTKEGDEGKYLITIVASDSKDQTIADVLVIIHPRNKAPIIECEDMLSFREGDDIDLGEECNIFDKEGDSIIITYSGWMTSETKEVKFGDDGTYTVLIKAEDDENVAQKELTIVIENVNRAPIISNVFDIQATETDLVTIEPKVTDPDGDTVLIEFSEPFNDEGIWATKDGDAGSYEAYISATDGSATSTKKFKVDISNINTAPVLERIPEIAVEEGDTIELPINAYDPEGDEINVKVTGWMTSQVYETDYDDAGEHIVTVTVSDGLLETSQNVKIIVVDINRPPKFVW
ncbi:MAG: hypothetical protein ABIE94_06185 [archaeon]